jgi:hypothetical protein
MGYSVVEVTDDNVPVPQPAEAPAAPAYRVVLVGEEASPVPPRPSPPPRAPDREPDPAVPFSRPGLAIGVLAFLACFPVLLLLMLTLGSAPVGPVVGIPVPTRGGFVPDAPPLPMVGERAPLASLLPEPPKADRAPVYVGEDLSRVPELALEAGPGAMADHWRSRKARAMAAAVHLNKKEEDGFLKAVLRSRPDLAGLPFAMGDACRTPGDRARAFKDAAESAASKKGAALMRLTAAADAGEGKRQESYQASLAVAMQVMPAQDFAGQNALIHVLSSIPRPEATQALARVAVFSTDEAARAAAVDALAVRREADATGVLVAALSYPWPAVADNAASAIVKLKRKDLVPQLRAALDAPDPRGPRTEETAGREETVAHELVRINHLRNCMLCHAAAERHGTPAEALVAEVPVPTEPLPDTSSGYGQTGSSLLVRVDVTYLRQDFSAMQNVTDWTLAAWPPRQRFDFVVRRRVLTPVEAEDLRTRLAGESPYRRAAARALRELADLEAGGG